MSFKFPLFEELFIGSPQSKDPNTYVMSIKIDTYKSDILDKYLTLYPSKITTKTMRIGYINGFITNKIKDHGSYIIIINSYQTGGPNSIFCISRSDKLSHGIINKLIDSKGIHNDSIELEWNPAEYPLLKYNYKTLYNFNKTDIEYNNIISSKLTFFIKIISTF